MIRSLSRFLLMFCLASMPVFSQADGNQCGGRIELARFEAGENGPAEITFRITTSTTSSYGTYSYKAIYRDTGTGQLREKVWSRPWAKTGESDFEVSDPVSLGKDELLDSVQGERIEQCSE
jgi:hypothetical protein